MHVSSHQNEPQQCGVEGLRISRGGVPLTLKCSEFNLSGSKSQLPAYRCLQGAGRIKSHATLTGRT
eukprot:1141041-Pelagomonas_calceolata.AAC.13